MSGISSDGIHRILFIITQGILGGAQTHIQHLSKELQERGYEVHVAIGNPGPLNDVLLEQGVTVHSVPTMVREISPLSDYRAYKAVKKLLLVVKPDLVSTHSSKAGMLGRMAASSYNIPCLFTAHGWAFTDGVPMLKKRIYILLERMAASWAENIICVSENDRQLALKYHVGTELQLVTIHNGMPVINDELIAQPGNDELVSIIMVARFFKPKDHQQFLAALKMVTTKKEYQVILVGDGELMSSVRERAQQLGIQDRIKFLGARTDVPDLLANSHIFVLVTNWEGFPRSILEAMRASLPVVASDVGGVREAVIDGQTGYLVPRGDVESLARCLEKFINDPKSRADMGRNARKRFEENFTFEQMLNKTVSVYDEVLKQVRGRGGEC